MIVDNKLQLPNDPTPLDAPPSYEDLSSPRNDFAPEKSSSSNSRPSSTVASTSSQPTSPLNSPPIVKSTSASAKSKGPATWFNFSASRTTREVRATVIGLVRDLVREYQTNSSAAPGILHSCAEACSARSLSLSSILQEKSIEGHTPLYWAIVKRAPDESIEDSTQIPDLLTALLSHSSPLLPSTITEIRRACLVTSDQHLFQRLRMAPEFSPISPMDQMLLGDTIPPDEISVENVPGDEGSFAVNFEIIQFQKRMMVTKSIPLDFIARGRMWRLSFDIASGSTHSTPRQGSWCVSLSLLENSPPTWIDSRLIIPEPTPPGPASGSTLPETESVTTPPASTFPVMPHWPGSRSKPRPTIILRLRASEQLTANERPIIASLEDSLMGTSLQYAGSSYIAPDEKLRARLEAKLGKPEGGDCIIC